MLYVRPNSVFLYAALSRAFVFAQSGHFSVFLPALVFPLVSVLTSLTCPPSGLHPVCHAVTFSQRVRSDLVIV